MKSINVGDRNYTIIFVFIIIILFTKSCISPYSADYEGVEDLLVVDGSLIKGNEEQVIKISRSSSIQIPKYHNPSYQPLGGCEVIVLDDIGNEFIFTEEAEGEYVAAIDDALLNYGSLYKLELSTPSGENYESDFQELLKTGPVDSIYSVEEYHYNSELNANTFQGFQFYVDLDAPDDASKYYKWQIQETWEVRSQFKISGVYNGQTVELNNWPEDSLYYCWKTQIANGIYTASTAKLSQNTIREIPLHFKLIDAKELGVKYCATVKQYALNRDAYEYWHQRELELKESGQIYTRQPNQFESNIYNINNPEEKVLGFFWVSSFSLKHTFLENGRGGELAEACENISMFFNSLTASHIEGSLLNLIQQTTKEVPEPPLYIYYICGISGCIYSVALTNDCIDCRLMGGTNIKPDFWGWHPSDMSY